jgi:hypothetical protein
MENTHDPKFQAALLAHFQLVVEAGKSTLFEIQSL